jgi:hypothetical protein
MGNRIVSLLGDGGGGGGSLPPKVVLVPADFPTIAEANNDIGRVYVAGANVTDNDPTKTNTGQSFLSGEEFIWDGVSAYFKLGADALWLDDGSTLSPVNPRAIKTGNLKLQGNTLSATNTDGDIHLIPDGNGGLSNVGETLGGVLRLYNGTGTLTLDQSFLLSNAASAAATQWQSLTAGLSGLLDKVSIQNQSGITATSVIVSIYAGTGIGGQLLSQETGITAPNGVLTDVTLTTKPHIVSGQVYTIQVSGSNWNWAIQVGGGYPGGSYRGGADDAKFRTYVDIGYELFFDRPGKIFHNATDYTFSGQNLNFSGIPLVLVTLPSIQVDQTGDGTLFTIPYTNVIKNHGGHYNTGTYIFTAPVTGTYRVGVNTWLRDVGAGHTSGIGYITTTTNSHRYYQGSPANHRDASNEMVMNGYIETQLTASDTLQSQVVVSNSTKTVDISTTGITQLSINLLSTS